jgi:hypothetical protein
MRALLLAHRWLGMATGLLMVTWCLSGVVMMYVAYPRLTEGERTRGLAPMSWTGCCVFGADAASAASGDFGIEMLAGRPVLRGDRGGTLDLVTGAAVESISATQAVEIADAFARRGDEMRPAPVARARPTLLDVVYDDAWTVSGVSRRDRPLYRFDLGDAAGTELYVSSVDGKAAQVTNARQRFWSWLGAIPHWLYMVRLRRHPRVWSAVVVSASLAGCFLTATGVAIGVQSFRRSRGHPRYRGIHRWHHAAGVVFGLFTWTWIASGLLSMNPWGWLEGGGVRVERARLRGPAPDFARVRSAVLGLATAGVAQEAVAIAYAPFAGAIYFVVETTSGTRFRVDEAGRLAPLTTADMAHVAMQLGVGDPIASMEYMTMEDAYFFSHGATAAPLPVYRIILGDREATRYYLDPVSAEIEAKVDRNVKGYRWLHQGLHRLDVLPGLRQRPTWDVVMLSLLAGVFTVSVTGAYLGVRRLFARARRPVREARAHSRTG